MSLIDGFGKPLTPIPLSVSYRGTDADQAMRMAGQRGDDGGRGRGVAGLILQWIVASITFRHAGRGAFGWQQSLMVLVLLGIRDAFYHFIHGVMDEFLAELGKHVGLTILEGGFHSGGSMPR